MSARSSAESSELSEISAASVVIRRYPFVLCSWGRLRRALGRGCIGLDLQQQLLCGLVTRRRLQRREHALLGVLELVGAEISLRQVIARSGQIERMHRDQRGELSDRSRGIVLREPELPEPQVQLLIID